MLCNACDLVRQDETDEDASNSYPGRHDFYSSA